MIIKKGRERLTSQKQIILDFLKNTQSHPSALEVYQGIKAKLPRVSIATVYRLLEQFKEKGKIQELQPEESCARYDGNPNFHVHFVCDRCKNVFDVLSLCQKCAVSQQREIKIGKIKQYKIYFYGICQKCQKEGGTNEKNN